MPFASFFPNPSASQQRRALLVLALAIVALAANAASYWPFLSDDSLISLRYSERLLEGHGLTWTDGEVVEGYSNLLWVLLAAGLGALGLDLIDALRVMCLTCMLVPLVAMTRWSLARRAPGATAALALGLAFFALATPTGAWAIGGLEQPLVAALLACAIPLSLELADSEAPRPTTAPMLGAFLGLACLTRPDGPLFCAAIVAALPVAWRLQGRKIDLKRLAIIVAIPALCYAGQLAFRLAYYGELVPNTALVKAQPSVPHLLRGWRYVHEGLWSAAPLSLLALAGLVVTLLRPASRGRGVVLAALFAAWSSYVSVIGGDIFPAFRHGVPILVILSFALIEAAAPLAARLASLGGRSRAAAAIAALAMVAGYCWHQQTNEASANVRQELWEWTCKKLALPLRRAFADEAPLLAVTAAGCLPYWSKLPSLDLLGLNDYYLPRHPPPSFGKGWIGHELGDNEYLLRRRPDIVVFGTGIYPQFAYREIGSHPVFAEGYSRVAFWAEGEDGLMAYFDETSPKVGVRRTDTAIEIPGYFLFSMSALVHVDDRGIPRARIPPGDIAAVTIAADPRRFEVEVTSSAPAGQVEVTTERSGSELVIRAHNRGASAVDVERITLRAKPGGA